MPEFLLRKAGTTCSTCGSFNKNREKIQKLKEIGDLNYMYQKELEKACFVHHAAYADSKDLAKRTVSDKILENRDYETVLNLKHYEYQR